MGSETACHARDAGDAEEDEFRRDRGGNCLQQRSPFDGDAEQEPAGEEPEEGSNGRAGGQPGAGTAADGDEREEEGPGGKPTNDACRHNPTVGFGRSVYSVDVID